MKEIRIAIKNANGLRNSLFVNEMAFENLIKKQILRLRSPCLECAGLVHVELRKLIKMINIPELERFQNMTNEITKVMEKYLQKCLMPTEDMIRNLIEIELGFINTNHPDFCGGALAIIDVLKYDEEKEGEKPPLSKPEGSGSMRTGFLKLFELLKLHLIYAREEKKNEIKQDSGSYWPSIGSIGGLFSRNNRVLMFFFKF